jgi:hypothetical protein
MARHRHTHIISQERVETLEIAKFGRTLMQLAERLQLPPSAIGMLRDILHESRLYGSLLNTKRTRVRIGVAPTVTDANDGILEGTVQGRRLSGLTRAGKIGECASRQCDSSLVTNQDGFGSTLLQFWVGGLKRYREQRGGSGQTQEHYPGEGWDGALPVAWMGR